MDQLPNMIYVASIWVIPLVAAITFHEAAHGYVAHFLGDETAWRLGRVSLNPLKHIDPVGTILLPGLLMLLRSPFLFGYAKPVLGAQLGVDLSIVSQVIGSSTNSIIGAVLRLTGNI